MPIGTASAGVRRAGSPDELRQVAEDYERLGAFGPDGVLVQAPVAGPLAMVQAVFARGELVAFHACERVREGAAGGASHKLGLDLPEAREHMAALGAFLDWHGALSADVILGPDGPRFIDINPRLVEPVNALASRRRPGAGADRGGHGRDVAPAAGRAGGRADPSAPARRARRGAARFAAGGGARAARRRAAPRRLPGQPGRADPGARRPAGSAARHGHRAGHADPAGAWRHFAGGSAGAYSLTPAAWRQIRQAAADGPGAVAPGPPSGLVSRALTCWTPEIVPCAVCSAELTDEVPVIAAWIAVQMACDTFG